MNSHQTSSGRLEEMNPVKIWILKALYSIHDLIVTIQVVWFPVQGSRLVSLRSSYSPAGWRAGVNPVINMLRNKIVKRALQQGFSSRSRCLLRNLGLMHHVDLSHIYLPGEGGLASLEPPEPLDCARSTRWQGAWA